MNICFLTKKEKPYVDDAIDYLDKIAKKIDIYDGSSIEEFPVKIANESYDMIIAYISGWIVPSSILQKTNRWNINFHPGPPNYPGTGCFNFAIYDSVKSYGATAHIMDSKVDSGEIIGVKYFDISKNETVLSLSNKTYIELFSLFKSIIDYIAKNNSLPNTNEKWSKAPFKRSELEKLCEIDLSMNKDEIYRRIKATYFDGKPGPFINIGGYKFEYNPER
tara:strand:+ start:6982 stop:7641 length:660 start_codon:yes stop_codon:yes gene_type:complete